MQRRSFASTAIAGAALATGLAAPAVVRAQPKLRWRLTSSWPKNLDTIYAGAEQVAKRVKEATNGAWDITVHAPGELVPAFGVLDAVQQGTVEAAHTASVFFFGKDPTFALDGQIPFGMNSRQMTAWMKDGEGLPLLREFYRDYNIVNFPCGNTGTQMGGFFRKEIKSLDDMKGLKFRIGGFGGVVLSRIGVLAQNIPGGEIYTAPRKGYDRRRRIHRSLRRREARPAQDRQVLSLPELLGRLRPDLDVRRQQGLGVAAQGLPGDLRGRLRRGPCRHAGQVRRAQSAGA